MWTSKGYNWRMHGFAPVFSALSRTPFLDSSQASGKNQWEKVVHYLGNARKGGVTRGKEELVADTVDWHVVTTGVNLGITLALSNS